MPEIKQILEELSKKRQLFHNERDFQLELGMLLNEKHPNKIRLEYRYNKIEKAYADIMILDDSNQPYFAIELKYLSKKGDITYNNELFSFKQCSTNKRIATIKEDEARIKTFKNGCCIVLSNDERFIKNTYFSNWLEYSRPNNETIFYFCIK